MAWSFDVDVWCAPLGSRSGDGADLSTGRSTSTIVPSAMREVAPEAPDARRVRRPRDRTRTLPRMGCPDPDRPRARPECAAQPGAWSLNAARQCRTSGRWWPVFNSAVCAHNQRVAGFMSCPRYQEVCLSAVRPSDLACRHLAMAGLPGGSRHCDAGLAVASIAAAWRVRTPSLAKMAETWWSTGLSGDDQAVGRSPRWCARCR